MVTYSNDVQDIQAKLMELGYHFGHGADGGYGPEVKSMLGIFITKHFDAIKTDPEYADLKEQITTKDALDPAKLSALLNNDALMEKQMLDGNIYSLVTAERDSASNLKTNHATLATLGLYDGKADGLDGPKTQAAIKTMVDRAIAADENNKDFFEKDAAGAVQLYNDKNEKVAKDGKPKVIYPPVSDLSVDDSALQKLFAAEEKKITALQEQATLMAGFGAQYAVDADKVMIDGKPSPELVEKAKLFFDHIRQASGPGSLPGLATNGQVEAELTSPSLGYVEKAKAIAKERDSIATAQKELKARGHYKGEVNGVFTPEMNDALFAYGKEWDDGEKDKHFLIPADGKHPIFKGGKDEFIRDESGLLGSLTRSSKESTAVIEMQTLLHDVHGPDGKPYYSGKLDGIPGEKTALGLQAYAKTLSETTDPKKSEIDELFTTDKTKPLAFVTEPGLGYYLTDGSTLSGNLDTVKQEQANVRLLQQYLKQTPVAFEGDKPKLDAEGKLIEDPKGKLLYTGNVDGLWNEKLAAAAKSAGFGGGGGAALMAKDPKSGEKSNSLLLDQAISHLDHQFVIAMKQKFTELGLFKASHLDDQHQTNTGQTDVKTGKDFSTIFNEFMHKKGMREDISLHVQDDHAKMAVQIVDDALAEHRHSAQARKGQKIDTKTEKALAEVDLGFMNDYLNQKSVDPTKLAKNLGQTGGKVMV